MSGGVYREQVSSENCSNGVSVAGETNRFALESVHTPEDRTERRCPLKCSRKIADLFIGMQQPSPSLDSAKFDLISTRIEHERLIAVLCGEPNDEEGTIKAIRKALLDVQAAYEAYSAALRESLERSSSARRS